MYKPKRLNFEYESNLPPSTVSNIIYRPQAFNRIEIEMCYTKFVKIQQISKVLPFTQNKDIQYHYTQHQYTTPPSFYSMAVYEKDVPKHHQQMPREQECNYCKHWMSATAKSVYIFICRYKYFLVSITIVVFFTYPICTYIFVIGKYI